MEREKLVKEVIRQYDVQMAGRSTWCNIWNEIRDLVRPSSGDFYNSFANEGRTGAEKIYDSTPAWANSQLASGLNSYLTSPVERWFNLKLDGEKISRGSTKKWLEAVADIIFTEYARPSAAFSTSISETYSDVTSFGTAVLNQEPHPDGGLLFKAFPLADCQISEDANGKVNRLFRAVQWTSYQCMQRFGEKNVSEKIRDNKDPNKLYKLIHVVIPRDDRNVRKVTPINMAFGSYWIEYDEKKLLSESGYQEFPYHVPRWTKMSGEMYGRSPAWEALPDIRMLNAMAKVTIKAAQKIVDPPLMVPDDGFILPIKTAPSSLLFYTAGSEDRVEPLRTFGRPEIGLEMMNQRREQIIKAFYVDFLLQQKNNVEMTATEVMDRREEKFRQMAPMLGRIQMELLGPMLSRSFQILARQGRIPPPPAGIPTNRLLVEYVSPAALAQYGTKLVNINQFTQALVPFAQVDPTIMDVVNTDALAETLAELTNVSRVIINEPEVIAEKRKQRAQAQQQQQQTELGVQQSEIMKNLSTAKQQGGSVPG